MKSLCGDRRGINGRLTMFKIPSLEDIYLRQRIRPGAVEGLRTGQGTKEGRRSHDDELLSGPGHGDVEAVGQIKKVDFSAEDIGIGQRHAENNQIPLLPLNALDGVHENVFGSHTALGQELANADILSPMGSNDCNVPRGQSAFHGIPHEVGNEGGLFRGLLTAAFVTHQDKLDNMGSLENVSVLSPAFQLKRALFGHGS